MQERGAGQQYGDYSYDEEDFPQQSGSLGPYRAAAPRGPRTGLVVGAVAVAAALAVAAVVVTRGSGGKHDAPAAQNVTTTGATATASASVTASASTSPTSAASASAPASGTKSPYVLPAAAARAAGAFYGAAQLALTGQASLADPKSGFVSATVAAHYWDATAKKPTAAALCGATAPMVAIVSGTGTSAAVALSAHGTFAAKQAHVTVDPKTGKISAISCVAAPAPAYPGTAALLAHFGGSNPGVPSPSSHLYAPKSADGPSNLFDVDGSVCAQYLPQTWVFYAPVATSSGLAWPFVYDGGESPYQIGAEVFTDPSDGTIERMLCYGFPAIPAPDKAAAGKAVDGGLDPATRMVDELFSAYIQERSQMSAGAVPADEMAPYFTSPTTYLTALHATGKVPFLCSGKAPDIVQLGTPKVSGSTETFEASVGYQADPMSGPIVSYGKEKVVVDLTTMKISSITCS